MIYNVNRTGEMISYKVFLNNGNEALGVTEKTITANEELQTVGISVQRKDVVEKEMVKRKDSDGPSDEGDGPSAEG